MNAGVSFFISQCVFNIDYAKQVVEAVMTSCRSLQIAPPVIIFTITACGSAKTLQFMEWLGIHVPEDLKAELSTSADMLEKSVSICLNIAAALTEYCMEQGIPFGFNIESVAIRKAEIEASVFLTNEIDQMLQQKGVRKPAPAVNTLQDSF